MKTRKTRKLIAFFMAMLLFAGIVQFPEKASAEAALDINADAAILVEAETGKILYGKNIDSALGIASMSKMMTEYLLFEAVKKGKVKWDQEYTVSPYAHKVSLDTSLSNVPLEEGKKYTLRELYEAMAIYSANAATIGIAETIGGTEAGFVKMMNEKAKELGLDNYKFVNSSGLNNSDLKGMHPEGSGPEDENVMSARSTASLAFRLLQDYPDVIQTTSTAKKEFRGMDQPMKNWNWMLPGFIFEYKGVDGLKTGTTDFAGYCFTGTAKRDNMRVITVVMNAKGSGGKGDYKARFDETKKMLDYAFTNFSVKEILPAGYKPKKHDTLPVIKGKEKVAGIVTKEPVHIAVKNGEEKSYKTVVKIDKKKLDEDGNLIAPLKKGEKVGTLQAVYKGNDDFGYLDKSKSASADVVTSADVEKANWFVLMMRGIGGFFSDIWSSAVSAVKGWF